ncbi:hypothetical protein SAMN05446589_9844 [Streptomyces sp. OV198]|nr:hypothetical protein SAMN05446589_9844 [Streptomyces sp. OV198]
MLIAVTGPARGALVPAPARGPVGRRRRYGRLLKSSSSPARRPGAGMAGPGYRPHRYPGPAVPAPAPVKRGEGQASWRWKVAMSK